MKRSSVPPEFLKNGQVWQMEDASLQIELVGKRLVHYKLFKGQLKRAPISLSPKDVIQKYLQKHKAILVQEFASTMSPPVLSGSKGL